MTEKILVTGAGGGVGRSVARRLAERGETVRAFVKSEEQARVARADGAAEVVIGDIRSDADVAGAVPGVTRVFHVCPTAVVREVSIAEGLVAAARANDVEHIVFNSVIHPEIKELPHHQEKLRVEGVLHSSDVPTTVLRPSHFMQNYLDFWDLMLAGTLPYPSSPTSVMGVVDAEDIGEVGAMITASPEGHADQTYDLSTQELARHEMATIWSGVLGHTVSAVRLPPSAVKRPLQGVGAAAAIVAKSLASTRTHALSNVVRGLAASSNTRGVRNWPEESQDCYVAMMTYYDTVGLPAGDMEVLPKLLGRPATSYREFAAREAARRGVATR
ncbi:NmrA family NAD(P)-binding protein [Williamsia phyllosphaerae]|uniref:NmrA family NAD(P)-binding protein n=1 Tax=Williamsia phyllosphaerae TaxID=885042 RepID=UPI001E422D16|nr:NmrA family NAD(P)-binding protein [Williamsia phyllosphaerae]